MIMLGTPDGRDAGVLRKTKDEDFFRLLKNPPPDINDIGKYLFIHVADEPGKWRPLMKKLPYALCGIFSPAANRKENFAWADRFFLWIRYCGEMDFDKDDPRRRIIRDREVLMCFSTPRPVGLIVMFALSKRCHDAGLYSVFCRKFASEFARRHRIEKYVNTAYADVTRICPVAGDRGMYYNPEAARVNISDYVDTGNPEEALRIKRREDDRAKEERKHNQKVPKPPADPEGDILDAIRKKLGSRVRARPSGAAADPGKTARIAEELTKELGDAGMEVTGIENIRGTLKIRATLGTKSAEVNVFPGKKGFTALFAPLSGTDTELSRILADMVQNFLANM